MQVIGVDVQNVIRIILKSIELHTYQAEIKRYNLDVGTVQLIIHEQ